MYGIVWLTNCASIAQDKGHGVKVPDVVYTDDLEWRVGERRTLAPRSKAILLGSATEGSRGNWNSWLIKNSRKTK